MLPVARKVPEATTSTSGTCAPPWNLHHESQIPRSPPRGLSPKSGGHPVGNADKVMPGIRKTTGRKKRHPCGATKQQPNSVLSLRFIQFHGLPAPAQEIDAMPVFVVHHDDVQATEPHSTDSLSWVIEPTHNRAWPDRNAAAATPFAAHPANLSLPIASPCRNPLTRPVLATLPVLRSRHSAVAFAPLVAASSQQSPLCGHCLAPPRSPDFIISIQPRHRQNRTP